MKKYITSERPNIFEPNVYISMVVKIEGNIAAEKLSESVHTAYASNESTMSKVVLEENGNGYYEGLSESGCKIIIDNRRWEEIINHSEKQAFNIKDGELVRTFIITENDGLTLLVHAHHLVGDGKSILILLNDILNSLNGKELDFKPMVLIDNDYLNERAKLPIGARMLVNSVNRKWKKKNIAFGWDDYYAVHEKYHSSHSSDFVIKTYNVNELKKRCVNGTTINSLLITEMLKSSPEIKVIGIPVSIRQNDKSISNQTSGVAVKYRYNKNRSFDENLAKLHNRIYKRLNNNNARYFVLMFVASLCPSLVDSVLLQTHGCYADGLSVKMAEIMGYTDKNTRDIGVTNLGIIDIPTDYNGFKVIDIIFIPPKISYSKKVVGISTYGDRLTVCIQQA